MAKSLEESTKICREMQKWRRGEGDYSEVNPSKYKPMPYSPKEFGDAIDKLILFAESSIKCCDLFTLISNVKNKK